MDKWRPNIFISDPVVVSVILWLGSHLIDNAANKNCLGPCNDLPAMNKVWKHYLYLPVRQFPQKKKWIHCLKP